MTKQAISALLAITLLLCVACRTETEQPLLGTTDTAETTGTHPGSPGGTALVPSVAAGTTVLVMLGENTLALREQSIPPGPAVLTIENAGTQVHNLSVEGNGAAVSAGDTIPAGSSRTLDITFTPGTYTFYCPVLDHRDKGEQVELTIRADGSSAATDTAASATTPATETTGR